MTAKHKSLALAEPFERGAAPRELEALDGAGWRQTKKDLPLAVLGSAIGYAVGQAAATHVLSRMGTQGAPDWMKHVPRAIGAAHAIGVPVLQHKLNKMLQERRDQRRAAEAVNQAASK